MSMMFGKVKTYNAAAAPDQSPAECNLVLLGVMGSGKSALTVKFLTKRFIGEYDPHLGTCLSAASEFYSLKLYSASVAITVAEDIFSCQDVVDNQPVTIRVMDTFDQDGPVNSERYLSWADAFLVVYSIDNAESFKGCQLYLQTLSLHNKTCRPQTPIFLLGNKLDMDRYRQVSRCDGETLASQFGCLFFEVSACLDFVSVQHVFYEAVRRSRRGRGRSHNAPAVYLNEDKALLDAPSFTTPCYKELPAPATAKLVTVKASRAQSKRRATTLTLLKGFKIF